MLHMTGAEYTNKINSFSSQHVEIEQGANMNILYWGSVSSKLSWK